MEERLIKFFITICYQNNSLANRVLMSGESHEMIRAAKTVRKHMADELKINCPSKLSWAIFKEYKDKTPILSSKNWSML